MVVGLTFTEMMYAIVKKVVSPARSSVVNLVFLISRSFNDQLPRPTRV